MRVGRTLPLFAIVLLLCFTLACTRNALNRAQEYELEGKNASALQLYQAVLAHGSLSGPQRAEVLMRIGECLFHMGRMQEAFTTFQKAAESDPNNTLAHLHMGQMLLGADAPDRAREQANIILKKTPSSIEALTLLGAAWADSGNLDLAKQAYLQVLERNPQRVKVAIALADIYSHEGDDDKAKQILKHSISADPTDSAPWLMLARLNEQEGDSRGAEESYRKAVAVQDTRETNLRLAQFLQRSARIAEAEQTLRKVDSQDPNDPVALADFQLLSGRPGDAIERYQKALNSVRPQPAPKTRRWSFALSGAQPRTASVDSGIAARMVEAEIVTASRQQGEKRSRAMATVRSRLQEHRARFDDATADILQAELAIADNNPSLARMFAQSAIELAPESAPAHYVAGLAASASGDDDTAESEWQNAVDQDEHFGPARLALAQDALARANGDEADEQARAVVRDNPGDLQAILVFARALLLEGKTVPAAIMAQRASALDPVSPEPSLILGQVALKVGNVPQALLNFERALSLQPDSEEAINGLLAVYQKGRLSYSAIQKMEVVAQQPPVSPTLLQIAGRLYAERGWYSDAIRALQRTVQLDPKCTSAARTLARLQAATGDFTGATDSAMKAGFDSRTLLTAYREQKSGDWKKAASTYERAVREGDQTGVAANNVAWLYAEHNAQLDHALQLAETAVHDAPTNPAMFDTLGFVRLQRREYSDAVKLLETATRLAAVGPASADQSLQDQIREHLKEAYMRAGQTKAALKLAQNRGPFSIR